MGGSLLRLSLGFTGVLLLAICYVAASNGLLPNNVAGLSFVAGSLIAGSSLSIAAMVGN